MKTPMRSQQLWQLLTDAAMVEGEMPAHSAARSPWFVRVMLSIAGWIGAAFLLAFVGAAFSRIWDNGPAATIAGLIVCSGAFFIFKSARDNDFAAQFGMAISFAGQVLFSMGLYKLFHLEGAVGCLV